MLGGRTFAALALTIGAVLCTSLQLSAASRGGNRDLEKVFKNCGFSESEASSVARAFKVAVDAGVEDRDALELVSSCVGGDLSADQVGRMLTVAAQLSLEHLPIDLFLSKVREGVSKRMEPGRVVQVAELRALKLKQASNLLKQAVLDGFSTRDREELLPDIAEALAGGMDQNAVREILVEAVEDGDSPGAIRRKLFP